MARNKNVGRTLANNLGLILQSKPELDRNEFGLIQASLKFHLKTGLFPGIFPELIPAQGTPCTSFITGNDATQSFLDTIFYLGAQTSRHIIHGHCPGIDSLEVLCQGAVFDNNAISGYRIASIPVATNGSNYDSAPDVDIDPTYELIPAVVTSRLAIQSLTIVSGGTGYTVGDLIAIAGGTYDFPLILHVTAVDAVATGVITAATTTVWLPPAQYITIPTNPCTVAGGTGTGATFDITWNVGTIVVTNGGEYSRRPTVSLSGGSPDTAATLRLAVMEPSFSGTNTAPFKPVTTVKDTTEFTVYGSGGTLAALTARLTTSSLPTYAHANPWFGQDVIYGTTPGHLPDIDGRAVNLADRVLLTDGTAFAGLYEVTQVGGWLNGVNSSWFMARVTELDESAEFTIAVYIQVTDGDINTGSVWNCTVSGAFTIDTDPATFALVPDVTPAFVPLYRVTIEYRAIELHFLYVSAIRRASPLYLQDEYQLTANGEIVTDTAAGETTALKIDSVTAIQQNVTVDPATGQITVTDGAALGISESVWRPWVKYIGTAAQFSQTPAGQFWSVEETATVKILGIPATGNIESF